jgi:hypothetical protein
VVPQVRPQALAAVELGAEFELVAGIKFRFELNDKHIREIQERGGHVVVLKSEYDLPDLQDARQSCKARHDGK